MNSPMPIRRLLEATALLLTAASLGCFVEVSSSHSDTSANSVQLASSIEFEFDSMAGGATANIHCSSGLTGIVGRETACQGETSDGYTLEIAVLERGGGAFRWDVVESNPIR